MLTGELSVSGPISRVREVVWQGEVWDDLELQLAKGRGPGFNNHEEEEDELVETDMGMKKFDLVIRIPGEDGSVDGEGRQWIAKAFIHSLWGRDKVHQWQEDVEDKL